MHAEKKLLIIGMVAVFMVMTAVNAAAVVMTAETKTGPSDQTMQISIIVDDPVGIAGAAFTLEYDTSLLSITVDSTFFDTFTNQFLGTPAEGTDSVTIGQDTFYQPLITNDISTGMRIAAARAAAETDSANTTLFTLNVDFIGACATPPQMPIPITVTSTVLNNTDAGYAADGETIAMLVGADASVTDLTSSAAFPVKLDPPNSIGSVVNGGATFNCPDYTISGSIAYSGPQTGQLYISTNGAGADMAWSTDPTAYSLDVPAGTYTINAYIDTDASGTKGAWEPQGAAAPVDVPPDATNVDISLTDNVNLESDADMLPDWWEAKYGFNPGNPDEDNNQVIDGNDDPDGDGLTNKEEYDCLSDPTDPNSVCPSTDKTLTLHAVGRTGAVNQYSVEIGISDTATSTPAPPPPVEYMGKMDLADDSFTLFSRDIRLQGEDDYRWSLVVDPHGNVGDIFSDYSATVSWDPAAVEAFKDLDLKSFTISWLDPDDGLEKPVVSDMTQESQFVATGRSSMVFYIDFNKSITVQLDLKAGWNLISLPVMPLDSNLTSLFPDAIVAYKFTGSYQQATTLEPVIGYWVKVPGDRLYDITGTKFSSYSVSLDPGWHLLGGVHCSAPVTPDTTVQGSISVMYGFNNAYQQAAEFTQGKGYWVKITQSSEFIVSCD